MLRAYKPLSLLRTSLIRYRPVTRILLFKQMSTKTEEDWKVVLTPEQFRVLRQKGITHVVSFCLERHLNTCNITFRNGASRNW